MSGHSKFSNIKHKKEKNDTMRGKIFTRIGRELAVAAREGGAEPSANGKLRDVIAKARANNMPNDTIERNIKKASGELSAVNYEQIVYEGYGPSGVAVMVEVFTDNRNRAAANVRNAFTKGAGNMGAAGCVSFMFDDRGLIIVHADSDEEDRLMELALDAGAMEFNADDGMFEIITEPEAFTPVREAFENAGVKIISAETTKLPRIFTELNSYDDIKKMNKLLNLLDDEDDVQNVWHNWIE